MIDCIVWTIGGICSVLPKASYACLKNLAKLDFIGIQAYIRYSSFNK
jgi:hypothetical protein